MFLLDDVVVYSASDLAVAASCEFAALRRLDAKLGRIVPLEVDDPLMERAARLGDHHEQHWLERYRQDLATRGGRLVEIERPGGNDYKNVAVLRAKHEETLDALRSGADVVFQGGFFDGRFHGWSDFIECQDDGTYAVLDTKLARHAKVTAALQLAAYGDQLLREGISVSPVAHLVLGDRTTTRHRLLDLIPAYRHRRARLESILDRHHSSVGPALWDDGHHTACGRCADCEAEIERTRDVLLVAGLSVVQRSRLHAAGIRTIDDLAGSDGGVPRIGAGTLGRLRAQARLQVRQAPPDGAAGPVDFEVIDGQRLAELPAPSPGDLFFDFEGDPLWTDGDVDQWGLEYLFGWVARPATPDSDPPFSALWAHDRAGERKAIERFVDHVTQRLAEHPDMHVYHYAPYETTALKRLAGRHGTREDELDALLRRGVFVDLYAVVRQAIRVSQPSYSIKKLEPLYMEARDGLDNAADSITDYAEACAARQRGDKGVADDLLYRIERYNEDDCVSTYLLLEWLRGQAPEGDTADATEDGPESADRTDPTVALLEASLLDHAAGTSDPADATALRMLAASLEYERREAKAFWWAHFDRLTSPVDEWSSSDVFIVDAERTAELTVSEHAGTWRTTGMQKNPRRRVRLAGIVAQGGQIRPGDKWWTLYDAGCGGRSTSTGGGRSWNGCGTTVLDVREERGLTVLDVEEACVPDGRWSDLPMALVPGSDKRRGPIKDALVALAAEVGSSGGFPSGRPALDVLRRRAPLGLRAARESAAERGWVDLVVTALRSGPDGYLPVQGPPGTGKTWNGAAVIRELVDDGWRVGVVAQSHAAVENMLRDVHKAGVSADCIGKKPNSSEPVPWRTLRSSAEFAALLADEGVVVGGTTWDFANTAKVEDRQLDLLVVDEAGQYCMAHLIAAGRSARRLLLLGDPQQLPQVSQGVHPEPVNESALAWIADGRSTLPPEAGILLDTSWRMSPVLCAAVSRLAYDGALKAHPSTEHRVLAGIDPGVHPVEVSHGGNRVESTEEAEAVTALVADLVGREWTPAGDTDARLLGQEGVIVVAAYNAQVHLIRERMEAAGFGEVPVGTVDKFQGQEAPVVIVSLAASSAADVPRGIEFLLNRNRLNVAVSRGQYAAFVVHSPRLKDHLPTNVAGLEELGAFVGLVG